MPPQDGPNDGRQQLDDVMSSFLVPVHREGWKFVGIALGLALVMFHVWTFLGWVFLILAGAIALFFRDPPRVTPVRPGLIVSPADGLVAALRVVRPPQELGLGSDERVRISIFLSVLDVHINRSPVSGTVRLASHIPGQFLNAAKADASEVNERRALLIRTPEGVDIGVVQIAGAIAKRIVPFVAEGDEVTVGQRIGLIRFGSRLDVYLPPGRQPQVALGQYAIGGETVLADLSSTEGRRQVRKG